MRYCDSNEITKDYLDSIVLKTRLIDSDLPSTEMELFGKTFSTPVMTAALSHLYNVRENGMVEMAKGAKAANAVYWCGMGSQEELTAITETGADVIKIIKPMADNDMIFSDIEHANRCKVFAMGMDIDHAYDRTGRYDMIEGIEMRPKTVEELKSFVAASEVPFIIKGVLSVEDAVKCVEIGAKGIVVSHHHGRMDYSAPPLMVLPEIVKAVGGRIKIFADCGFVTGADVFKGLALGADAICAGRGLMDALKEKGAEGVTEAINAITGNLASIAARTGYHSMKEIDDTCLLYL